MQLLRLQMRNFRRYRHQDVMFRDGITGILGNNGTGKSTIVDAILFCLYGVRETGLDYLLSANAGPRERAEVRLDFSVRGEEYQVVRSLGGKRHDVQLNHGGRLRAKGVSEVQEALKGILRMGHADFRHTIFSGQRELLTLVEAKPEERKEWFRRVLGIDILKSQGGEILRKEIQAGQERRLQIRGRMEGTDEESLRRQLGENEEARARGEEEIGKIGDEERTFGQRIQSLEKELADLRERETKSRSIRALIQAREEELTGITRDLGENQRELAALARSEEEFRTVAAEESLFDTRKEKYSDSRERARDHQDLMAREGDMRERLGECEKDLARSREEMSSLDSDEQRIAALAPAINRRSIIQSHLKEMAGLEERDRALSVRIDRIEGVLRESRREGKDLLSRIEILQREKERLKAIASGAGVPPDELGDPLRYLDARRSDLIKVIADATAGRTEASRRRETLEKDLAILGASGPDGTCPTCRQPLGSHYPDILLDLRHGIETEGEVISRLSEQIRKAEGETLTLENLIGEIRRLLDGSSSLGHLLARWEEIQERSLRDIAGKEEMEKERAALGYDPQRRRESERELTSLEKEWKEHLAAVERLRGRPSLARRVGDLEGRRRRMAEELAVLARDREKLAFDPAAHDLLKREFEAAEKNHARYQELKSRLDQVPVLRRQGEALGSRAETLMRTLGELQSELRGIALSPGDLDRGERNLRGLRDHLLELGRRRERIQVGLAHGEEDRERLTAMLGRLAEDRKEHDRLGEEIRLLELTRDQLNGFTDHLLGIVRDQIQEETGRLLSEITDGRYDTVILDDAFGILVHDLGGDYPVARFSGGEQDDVAIALRIALSRYIAEMHELQDSTFLIFDEIFGSQDEERRGNILRALRALEPYFPQIFLISHVPEVQGEFGNTLLVEAVSGNESRIRDLGEAAA